MNETNKGRSVFQTIVIPMIALVLAEVILLSIVLFGSDVVGQLNQSAEKVLVKQVESRANYLSSVLSNWSDLHHLRERIVDRTQWMLDNNAISLETLDRDNNACAPLLRGLTDDLVSTLYAKRLSGIFIVFNTTDISGVADREGIGLRTGVYIRDMDPDSPPTSANEDLTWERGPQSVIQASNFPISKNWRPRFSYPTGEANSDRASFVVPLQAAYADGAQGEPEDYGYWGTPRYDLLGVNESSITYSMPLVLDDGTVFGVLGVSVLSSHLAELLPTDEIYTTEGDEAYLLAVDTREADALTDIDLSFTVGEHIENHDLDDTVSLTPCRNGYIHTSHDGTRHFLSAHAISLYPSTSRFSQEHWILLGMAHTTALYRVSNQLLMWLVVGVVVMLALGSLGSFYISHRMSRPILRLSLQVEEAQLDSGTIPHLSPTGITEIDRFSNAITTLSRSVVDAADQERLRAERERDVDLLTGLLSRRAFITRANELFDEPEVLAHAAMIMLDLDNLKFFNDHYGHGCGDTYIRQAAGCFSANAPEKALCSRVSGDEFFLLFYGYPDGPSLQKDLDRFTKAIQSNTFRPGDGDPVPVSASGGVARYPEDADNLSMLMKYADFAMYQMKRVRKGDVGSFDLAAYNRESFFDKSRQEFLDMLREENVFFHFQPIVDAHTGKVFAYEALMRTDLPTLHSPLAILSIAREMSRLQDVESLTWLCAPQCFRELLRSGKAEPDTLLFVNSIANYHMPPRDIERFRQEVGELRNRLVVEIINAEDLTAESLRVKQSAPGLSGLFSLDNYSGSSTDDQALDELAPQFIKMDIGTIRDIDQDPEKRKSVKDLVDYAHERGIRVVAKGVENASELNAVLELGVDYLQGFFIAHPALVPKPVAPAVRERIRNFWTR